MTIVPSLIQTIWHAAVIGYKYTLKNKKLNVLIKSTIFSPRKNIFEASLGVVCVSRISFIPNQYFHPFWFILWPIKFLAISKIYKWIWTSMLLDLSSSSKSWKLSFLKYSKMNAKSFNQFQAVVFALCNNELVYPNAIIVVKQWIGIFGFYCCFGKKPLSFDIAVRTLSSHMCQTEWEKASYQVNKFLFELKIMFRIES